MRSFTFNWPHDAEEVYVTGTFDNWTKSQQLERVGQIFQKTVTLPDTSDKIYYKFVVDGTWTTDQTAPQEKDQEGNDNNVLLPEQMDKLEEASQAAAINNVIPESTTAQLAGAVPLEDTTKDKTEEKQEKQEEGEAATSDAPAVLNSAAPDSTTAQLAAAVPLEKKDDSLPGDYPESPKTDLEKEVKISPLPAAEGAINPIKLEAGEEVPKDVSASAIDKHVTLDKESYEKSDRIPGIDTETTLPAVTGNMIPESSLPVTGANDVTINTVTPEASTATMAGQVPLEEPKVPEIVKKSQEEAKVEPEASAISEEVKEKAAVEEELLEKVPEAPSTSEGTAGKGTEKSETDKTGAEKVLAAATVAGEVALGAAITAGSAAADIAAKASDAAADLAAKALPAASDAASKATVAASDAAGTATATASDAANKVTTAASDAATKLPETVKGALPGTAQEGTNENQAAIIDSVSAEVPAEVKESIKEAGASSEAAVNTAAVEEKKEYEAELLEKVKPAEALGELSTEKALGEIPTEAAGEIKPAEESKPADGPKQDEAVSKPMEESAPAEAPQAETKPKPVEEGMAQAVEPPQPVVAVKTVDETKAVDAPKPAEEVKHAGEAKPTEAALAVEPPKPAEAVKAVDEPKPAVEHPETTEQAAPAEAAKTVEAQPTTNGTTASPSADKAAADGQTTSEKKKKNRISGFFSKLKHKFA
ncbi:carbohydrate-binding module family 48 protein [Achaetomium macrosporum]|uniref:Carbohydrate-binding module family 48 protein n=1 Tax=Achaetomium macrosporum TaxID=79813 RepID=A0AAN7HCW1_9PEZI|nr:carbohydrate-binding module family 48 protein [Achaetomium macrosporum]